MPLGRVRRGRDKEVVAFAIEGEWDGAALDSSSFELEWPPRSGERQTFREADEAQWFNLDVAREKILPGQRPLLDRLTAQVRP